MKNGLSQRRKGAKPQKPDGGRSKMLARVHVRKKELHMSDEEWRAMLIANYAVDSSGKLSPQLLANLMRSLEGRATATPRKRTTYPGRPANAEGANSRALQIQKIEALLAEAKYPWCYADVLAQRICKVEKIAWVNPNELYKIIAALVKDAQRHGRPTRSPLLSERGGPKGRGEAP